MATPRSKGKSAGKDAALAREKLDWERLKLEFVVDPNKPGLSDYAMTHKIAYGTVRNRASRESWMTLRDKHWAQVTREAAPVIATMQAAVMARDSAQTLHQIGRMKRVALKWAGGTDEFEPEYEKPSDAVAAYEKLVKLERLELGESTENIRIDDARAFARALLTIVREEVADLGILRNISERAAALSVGHGPPLGADPSLN